MTRRALPLNFDRAFPGGSVHGRKATRWIVVRVDSGTIDRVISQTRSEAQLALDLIAGQFGEFIDLDAPETDNLVWWIGEDGPRLRATHLTLFEAQKPHATFRIGRADGTTVPEAPAVWHPVLRFYRLAYLTDDPIERFRYLYLAIENGVSTVSAKGPSEGEPAWLRRVLGSLSPTPDWSAIVGSAVPAGTDPVQFLVDEIYTQTRLPSFHAKNGQNLLLPVDRDAMTKAAAVCVIAHRLVHLLAPYAGYRLGGWTYAQGGFRLLTEGQLKDATIQFSGDTRPFGAGDVEFSDAAHPPDVLTPEPLEFTGFVCKVRAVVDAPSAPVARVGIVMPEYPLSATCYEVELRPSGFTAMELVMDVRMTQPGI
jgi:hypothetical protein